MHCYVVGPGLSEQMKTAVVFRVVIEPVETQLCAFQYIYSLHAQFTTHGTKGGG